MVRNLLISVYHNLVSIRENTEAAILTSASVSKVSGKKEQELWQKSIPIPKQHCICHTVLTNGIAIY